MNNLKQMSILLRLPYQLKYVCKLANTAHLVPVSLQKFSTSNKSCNDLRTLITDSHWTTIYRLPMIRIVSAFQRLKYYQAILTTLGTPVAFTLQEMVYTSIPLGPIVASLGITGLLTMCLASYALQNLIGFIYINKTGDKIKLAYVDFWGHRKHAFVRIEDLILDSEIAKSSNLNFYQAVRIYSDNKFKLKLLQKFGVIEEPQTFVELFGE